MIWVGIGLIVALVVVLLWIDHRILAPRIRACRCGNTWRGNGLVCDQCGRDLGPR